MVNVLADKEDMRAISMSTIRPWKYSEEEGRRSARDMPESTYNAIEANRR